MHTPLRVQTQQTHTAVDGRIREQQAGAPAWLRPALAIGAVALLLLLVSTFQLGKREVKPLRGQVEALEAEVANLQAQQPTCDSYSDQIEELRQLVNQGEFSLVSGMTNLYLNDHERPVCPEAKRALAGIAYDAALNNLFVAPLDDRTALLRWQEAERRADAQGLPPSDRWPPMSVVTQAYNAGLWGLARAAFLKAWGDGSVDRHNLQQVQLYYSILRNGGRALVIQGDGEERRAGLVYLRTADAISRTWGLAQGEAYQDLVTLLGPDSQHWPAPDAADPVLAAATPAGRQT